MHEVMVRSEEFFAPVKSKKERLKELADEVKKRNDSSSVNPQPEKIEAEDELKELDSSKEDSEEQLETIPGLNIDKVVEQLAKESGIDIQELNLEKKQNRKQSINTKDVEGIQPDSKDIKKQSDIANPEGISAEELRKLKRKEKKKQRAKEKKKKEWYTPKISSSIYVQGLPKDVTRAEVVEFFGRAGVFRLDHETGKLSLKQAKKNSNSTPWKIRRP
jgi:RNA recognition motif-containing protein